MPYFVSSEQTGNGSEQSIAHGMGVTPVNVLVIPQHTGLLFAYTATQGTHDDTYCKVTVTNGDTYVIHAWK